MKNIIDERHGFNTRSQKEGKSTDVFVMELKQKGSLCEFGELKDSLTRDRILCDIHSDTMRTGLLRERDLTLQCAIDICRTAEESESQLKEMGKEKSIHVLRRK